MALLREVNPRHVLLLFVLAGLLLAGGAARIGLREPAPPPEPPLHFDLLIRDALVVDGTGQPPFRADVGIVGDRIAALGDLADASAERILSVPGSYVAPGFINPHSHIDVGLDSDQDVAASLLQGITTELIGLDGESPIDLEAYFSKLIQGGGIGVNVGVLAGHGAIRRAVMGNQARRPSAGELERMKALLQSAMTAGAFGMSTGLEYVPGEYASTSELVALAQVVAEFGGLYVSHIRNERDRVLGAVQEALSIGRQAGVGVVISHIKVARMPGWPGHRSVLVNLSRQVVAEIDAARDRGQAVYADLYPYPVPWFLTRRRLSRAYPAYPLDSLEPVVPGLDTDGDTIVQLAGRWKTDPGTALTRLQQRYGDFPVAIHSIDEESLRLFLVQPFTMIGVDAPTAGGPWWGGVAHPRGFGTYPRVLGRYVRELALLSWGEAIKKMSGLPAQVYGLEGRGLIRSGYFADLVIFDPASVRDRATYGEPALPPTGIQYVIVNGRVAVEEGRLVRRPGPDGKPGTGIRAGRALLANRASAGSPPAAPSRSDR